MGDFVKVRKTGEWLNWEGFVKEIVWAKRSAQITVTIGIEEVVFSQKGPMGFVWSRPKTGGRSNANDLVHG